MVQMKEFLKQFFAELPDLIRSQGKKIIVFLLLACVVGMGIWFSYKNIKIANAKNQRALEFLKASISDKSGKKQQTSAKTKKPIKKTKKMKKDDTNVKK